MKMWNIVVVVLFGFIQLCVGGDFCKSSGDIFGKWCDYGCCGIYNDCCAPPIAVVSAGIIATIVICVIVGIGALIAVICCCIRRKGYTGQVVTRQQAPGMLVTSQTVYNQQGGYMQQPGIAPPQLATYPQTQQMQPPYFGQTNMAFTAGGPTDLGPSAPPPYSGLDAGAAPPQMKY